MTVRMSKALATWTGLNDRQQGTLAAIYDIEQGIEASRRRDAARGDWDSTPAAIWRRIDFAHDPSDRRMFGWTELQLRLASRGWDNQGNGSTMAALAGRGLITQDGRPTTFGLMRTVTLTREGRAAARAGTSLTPGPTPKAALSRRSWEVLAQLWAADRRRAPLAWGYSKTIDLVLINKHVPPLAQQTISGYEITDRGRDFYREHYATHTAAHPNVHAPHPDGTDAEPWPPQADDILTQHRQYYRALCSAWQDAHDAHLAAEHEAATVPPEPAQILPAEVIEQAAARHQLWQDTAQQRAELAATHAGDLNQRGSRAARAYAAAALAIFHAAVARTDPLDGLQPPGDDDAWDEQRLAPPSETGIHAIDAEAKKLHATAVGAPIRRRGPAPKHRNRRLAPGPKRPPLPGSDLAALADFLRSHAHGGALLRRLHPTSTEAAAH